MTTELRTFGGEPSTPHHGHAGWPVDEQEVLRRPNGYPVYRPRDPVTIDQRAAREFAARRGPNSE